MTDGLQDRIQFAHRLADASGSAIRPYFRKKLVVDDKGPAGHFDPVTEADKNAEKAIRELIAAHYPNDAILGEEMGETPGSTGYRWLIDPIDGTRAFITGVTLWGTLIGLEENGKPVLGILDQPVLNERFFGAPGKAELRTPEGITPLHVRPCARIAEGVVTTTHPFSYFSPEEFVSFDRLARKARLSRFHGDCYSYGLLALGFIDVVVEAGLKAWDVAALIPIVEAAGGIVSDWSGAPLWQTPIKAGQKINMIAAGDRRAHEEAVKILGG